LFSGKFNKHLSFEVKLPESGPMTIILMQKFRRSLKDEGEENLKIGKLITILFVKNLKFIVIS
jgi:hypothetical protein